MLLFKFFIINITLILLINSQNVKISPIEMSKLLIQCIQILKQEPDPIKRANYLSYLQKTLRKLKERREAMWDQNQIEINERNYFT